MEGIGIWNTTEHTTNRSFIFALAEQAATLAPQAKLLGLFHESSKQY